MPVDVSRGMGLNTDLPPDRIGDASFRIQNLRPQSDQTVRPREGVSKVANYKTGQVGRQVIVDGLPGDASGGLMVVALNCKATGTGATYALSHTVQGVFRFGPDIVSSRYAGTPTGIDFNAVIEGVVL